MGKTALKKETGQMLNKKLAQSEARNLAIPIFHQEKVIGVFTVGKPVDYDALDAKLLEAIASHIAPIVYEKLQEDE